MKLVYCGTPEESVGPLRALVGAGHQVVLVVTQPDRRRGRGGKLSPSPVKAAALDLGLPVSHRMKDLLEVEADLGIVVAFGRLIKSPVLEAFTWLNLHPSLLPRWRGATPVESAILAGDDLTGVCVMQLEAGMDTGPVYAKFITQIEPGETSTALSSRLFSVGTDLLLQVLSSDLLPEPTPQRGEPTYAQKLTPEDAHLDWSQSAEQLDRVIRLGRAWTTFDNKRFRILAAELIEPDSAPTASSKREPGAIRGLEVITGQGTLRLVQVQPEGKGPQDAKAWRNGTPAKPGDRFI